MSKHILDDIKWDEMKLQEKKLNQSKTDARTKRARCIILMCFLHCTNYRKRMSYGMLRAL